MWILQPAQRLTTARSMMLQVVTSWNFRVLLNYGRMPPVTSSESQGQHRQRVLRGKLQPLLRKTILHSFQSPGPHQKWNAGGQ